MNALVIAPQPFFTPRGTPFSVYHRARAMAEQGVKIDLLTYGRGSDVDIPGMRTVRIPPLRFLGPIPIGPSLKKLLLDAVLFVRLVGLLATRRYDFVQAHEEAVFACVVLQPLFRFRLLYDMHSSLPQQLENFAFTESRFLIRLFERLERVSLRKADAVITISPSLAEYAKGVMPEPSRHFLIENSLLDEVRLKCAAHAQSGGSEVPETAPSRVGSRRVPESRDVRNDSECVLGQVPIDARLVLYAGTFEAYQGLDILVAAFARVRARDARAFLLMVGGTPEQVARYRRLAADHGVSRWCLIEERVDQGTARRFERRADVLVSPRTEGTNTPLKIYGQLASGKPLVATRVPSHTQVLNDAVCFMVEPDPESLAEGVLRALEDAESRKSVVAAARTLYEGRYGRDAYHRKIRDVLSLLTS